MTPGAERSLHGCSLKADSDERVGGWMEDGFLLHDVHFLAVGVGGGGAG